MGNDWLADAWGDNPLSDPAISDAETTSDTAEDKATGFSDWHPAAHGYTWKTNPTPILHPIVLPHRARSHAHEGEGLQLNMMQSPVHKTLRQNPQQGVHRAPVRSVETRTGKKDSGAPRTPKNRPSPRLLGLIVQRKNIQKKYERRKGHQAHYFVRGVPSTNL